MNNRLGRFLIPVITLVVAGAWRMASDPVTLRPESKLWIDGKSTVRDFTCKAAALSASVEAAEAPVPAILSGSKAFTAVRFEVQASKLDCGNGTMNGHMLKALKAKDHPVIGFRLESYELTRSADTTRGVLTGVLAIGGTERPVTFPVTLQDSGDNTLRVVGTYELSMKEFGLEPPSLMLGTMKVRERVKVGFDLLLK